MSTGRRETRERRNSPPAREPTSKPTLHLHNRASAAGKGKAKEKTFMDLWVEPSLSTPQASYQDHGGAPFGVLEHMQPLGETPSARVKARVKAAAPSRASAAEEHRPIEIVDTPDHSPARGTPRLPTPTADSLTKPPSPPTIVVEIPDDDDDDDYSPAMKTKKKARPAQTRAPPPRPPRRKSESVVEPIVEFEKKTPGCLISAEDVWLSRGNPWDVLKLRRVIENANGRFKQAGRKNMTIVLNLLFERCLDDSRLAWIVHAVLTQNADEAAQKEFFDVVRDMRVQVGITRRQMEKSREEFAQSLRQNHGQSPKQRHDQGHEKGHGTPISLSSTATATPAAAATPQALDISTTRAPSAPAAVDTNPTSLTAPPLQKASQPTQPTKFSLKLKAPAKDSAATRPPVPSVPTKSPRKRADSGASDSSLTSLTSNEEADDMDLDEPDDLLPGDLRTMPTTALGATDGKLHLKNRDPYDATIKGRKRPALALDDSDTLDTTFGMKKRKLAAGVTRDFAVQESAIRPSLSEEANRSRRSRVEHLAGSNGNSGRQASDGHVPVNFDQEFSPLSWTSNMNGATRPAWHLDRASSPKLPKPPGKRAKIKQSPQKKAPAGHRGMTGVGGAGRDSPIGDDDLEGLSQNNDFCSGCGGNGYLLCCDGCCRSFHLYCLDPPLGKHSNELEEPWYCLVCQAKRRPATRDSPPPKPAHGLFAPLLHSLQKRNPTNFALPEEIRERYEGVATDKDGAFMEAKIASKTTRRNGYSEEQPDYYKLRDSKGNLILCYSCGKTSNGRRAIVTCDHCSQHWHLDCLDPPLANPPSLNRDGKKVHDWMCPLHADQELREVDVAMLMPTSRRRIHIRKPKHTRVVETALSRGFHNLGIIEIGSDDDDSDDSDSEFYEHDDGRTVYKLPANGIKLDFIDKVKHHRIQTLRDERAYAKRTLLSTSSVAPPSAPSALEQANFAKRPFAEKQLALNLAQFAQENQDLDFGGSSIENIVAALIAEASPAVVEQITRAESASTPPHTLSSTNTSTGHSSSHQTPSQQPLPPTSSSANDSQSQSQALLVPPSPPSSEQPEHSNAPLSLLLPQHQRKQLELLQELIRRKLEGCGKT